ncbi:MAG: hypothetical protein MI741_13505 [Rhodospirillales bacterium]|nr:hypothetical protein [Rhodospirillales bacterium]
MPDLTLLATELSEKLAAECRKHVRRKSDWLPSAIDRLMLDEALLYRFVEDLLEVVSDNRREPVHSLRPIIRRLLQQQEFVEQGGDCTIEANDANHLEQYVELTVRVLRRFRHEMFEDGEWSQTPVTPIMFG